MGIDFAGALHAMGEVNRVLVICPLSVVGNWEDEVKKHSDNWIMVYDPSSSFPVREPEQIEWHVTNFHSVFRQQREEDGSWYPVPNPELEAYDADLIIVDESHHIGNPSSVISKFTYLLGKQARFRLIMTGTMFHRKPFYVFGQFKFLDASIFGTAFGQFKKHIAVFGGYGGYEILRYQNLGWMMRKIKPHAYISKYVPPRNAVENVLHFHLRGSDLSYYAEMDKESIITVEGEEVLSPIVLSKHLRLQMIAGGWVKTETKYRRVGDSKKRIAQDRMNEYAEQDIDKFVVGCRFIPELRDAAECAVKAGYRVVLFHGGLTGPERTRRIRMFQTSGERVAFIAQIAAAKEGIDLSAASVMMFYSLTESFLDFDQFRSRIIRYGDNERTLMYDFLIAWGTRDEITHEALKLKQDVAQFIVNHPRRVERLSIKHPEK